LEHSGREDRATALLRCMMSFEIVALPIMYHAMLHRRTRTCDAEAA